MARDGETTRRTNRVVNIGLVAATAAALAGVLWLGIAAVRTAGHLGASERAGTQVDLLVGARTAALQARTDEALTLVARGGGQANEQSYTETMARLAGPDGNGGLLARIRRDATADPTTRAAAGTAAEHVRTWRATHGRLRALDAEGRYTEAVALAVGAGPDTTAAAFTRLDEELARAIGHNGAAFNRAAERARGALSGVDIGVALLTALLLTGAVLGIQRRMAEYR